MNNLSDSKFFRLPLGRIVAVGVGHSGESIIKHIIEEQDTRIELIIANTNEQNGYEALKSKCDSVVIISAVSSIMQNAFTAMNSLIEQQRLTNPTSSLGIIANRMPSVAYDMSGYRYTDIDPLTLDRDYNGEINGGREMFSNSTVALGRRGLAGMGWVNNLIEIRRVA